MGRRNICLSAIVMVVAALVTGWAWAAVPATDPAVALAAQGVAQAAQTAAVAAQSTANINAVIGFLTFLVTSALTAIGLVMNYRLKMVQITGKETHSLVNSKLGFQMLLVAEEIESRALSSGNPSDQRRAEVARRAYEEHEAAQVRLDKREEQKRGQKP